MKFQRMTARSLLILAAMLLGYGLLTVCLMFGAYIKSGAALATLVATAATSIAVPASALVALVIASWQHAEVNKSVPQPETEPEDPARAETKPEDPARARAPLIDRSIVLVGNGCEHLMVDASMDALRIEAGARAHASCRRPDDALVDE